MLKPAVNQNSKVSPEAVYFVILAAMNGTTVVPALMAVGFVVCLAQTEADYSTWMKDVAATKGKITKDLAAKQNTDAATGATHLADLFKQVAAFWATRSVSDAETTAKAAETAANDLAA